MSGRHGRRYAATAARVVAGLVLFWGGATQAAPPLEVYGRLPGVEQIVLSPAGTQYAFVAVMGESRKLGVASFDKELRYQIGVGDHKLRDLQWAGEDHVLATFSKTVDLPFLRERHHELDAVSVIQPQQRQIFSVFQKSASIAHTVRGHFGSALVDGRWQGFFGGITYTRSSSFSDYEYSHGYADLYRVDLVTGKPILEARGSYNHDGWALDADGSVVAHAMYVETSGRWRLYAGKARKTLLMERAAPLGEVNLVGMGRQPGTVLVMDKSGEADVLWEVSTADGRAVELLAEDAFDRLLFDPRSRLLIGARVPDPRGAVFFDPLAQARYEGTRKAFPGLQMELRSATSGLDRLLVRTDGGDDSGTFWLVDIASGKAGPLGYEYPGIGPADVAATRTYRYKAGDGLAIEAILTEPRGRPAKALPLVVLPHGGPIGVKDRVGFDWWAQAFASRGYVVMQPNYRGSSGYGRAFQQAGHGEWGGKMLSDIADGIRALAAEGAIDPRRVCIAGGSYGGYAALAGVTLQNGLYRCAVSVNGVSDVRAMLDEASRRHGYHSAVSRFLRSATGAATDSAVLREISPFRHAKRADAPILLIHGQDDTVVEASHSRRMADALRDADKPVELVMMPGEDHWLSRESTRKEMLQKSVEFVLRHNPPDPVTP